MRNNTYRGRGGLRTRRAVLVEGTFDFLEEARSLFLERFGDKARTRNIFIPSGILKFGSSILDVLPDGGQRRGPDNKLALLGQVDRTKGAGHPKKRANADTGLAKHLHNARGLRTSFEVM